MYCTLQIVVLSVSVILHFFVEFGVCRDYCVRPRQCRHDATVCGHDEGFNV